MDSPFKRVMAHIKKLEQLWAALEDRVSVLEEQSTDNRNRIEDLEEWQDEINNCLEKED